MIPSLIITGVAGAIAWFMGYNIASLTLYAIIGGIASFLSWVIGIISTVLTYILFQILSYNNFIDEDIVKMGWVTVRDLCNMFFILILLIIAFATILRIESYSWKKNLPKLLIMAVLINFSKTICGLVIDFSQVIMLTFVNAFASAGSYSLYTIFGLKDLFTIKTLVKASNTTTSMDANSGFAVVGSLVFGLILIIIATIVIAIYTIILIYRIIMLWILIILSPLAFLAMAIPAGAKYASQWTGEFTKYVVIGPVMAFFLWLALSMATTTTISIDNKYTNDKNEMVTTLTAPSGTGSVASEPANMKQFLVATLFLVAALMMAQQVGGAAGSIAGKGLDWAKKVGGAPLKVGEYAGKQGFFKAGRMADTLQMWGQGKIAKGVSKVTGGYFGEKYQAKSLNYRMIKEGWEKNQASKMRDYEGTKAGAWRDQFNRTLSASMGMPIVSQIMRKKSEKKVRENEEDKQKEQKLLDQDKEELKKAAPDDQAGLIASIKVREDKIKDLDGKTRSETKKSQQTWTLGKIPIQKYARLQEQEKANEEYTNIKKEDLDERGLVHNYDTEGRIDKKRAYLMHLADINGTNTLFDAKGIEMTAENISKFFKDEFGEAAGDVAAEVSRRAEAVGNYKMMGFHKFDVTQGKNTLASIDEQKAYSMKKDNERYAQAHARTTHFDSLVDRTEAGPKLSELGVQQLLHIASSTGRMKEIKNGNYQTRYGEMIIKIEADITNKADEFESDGRETEAAGLRKVLAAFKENYDILGKKEKKESDEEDKSGSSD